MEITSESVKTVPIEELAKIRQGLSSDHPEAIIIDNEIHLRRDRDAHELSREANDLSREANLIASSARDTARCANRIAITAAIIAAASMISTIIMAVSK